MTNEQTRTLVFKDQAGEYYLLPQETLEHGRVPAEHKAEVEQAVAAAQGGADGDDVQGHNAVAAGIAVACILYTGFDIAFDWVSSVRGPTPSPAPTIQFPPSQEPIRGHGGHPV